MQSIETWVEFEKVMQCQKNRQILGDLGHSWNVLKKLRNQTFQ